MQRATRNRGNNNNTNNPNLDSGPSSITTPTTFVDQQRRGRLTGVVSDQHTTISLDSEDDPATECSFEYDDDGFLRNSINESDLSGPITSRGGGVHRISRGDGKSLDDDKPTTLRGLERLSTETEEFAENESSGGPEDIDLESFKRVYMTDFVIPEEPDKESAAVQLETQSKDNSKSNLKEKDSSTNSEASKWRRRFRLDERLNETIDSNQENERNNNNHEEMISQNKQSSIITTDPQMLSESDLDKPMSISDIEQFVQSTCDQVMEKVRAENDGNETDESESVRGSGIFKIRPGLKCESSLDSRVSASTDATLSTIEIPTITITEDQLDDSSVVLSEATLRDEGASDYEGGEISQDGGSNKSGLAGRASALKFRVKKLGSKVKDIFKRGTTPEVSPSPSPVCEYIDIDEEKRRRKEEEKEAERKRRDEEAARKEEADRRKRDEELEKRALEMERKAGAEIAKERERLRKEEAKRQKEEEKRRKEEEERLRKEEEKARKEEEKARKEEEKRLKAEEKKRREEEEKKKKEEEKTKKMLEEKEKRKIQEEEERKLAEEEKKRQIAEEEEARKRWAIEDAEKRRRWIAEQAEQTRIKFEEEMERKRKQKILDEEEAERRRQREAEEKEKRRKREMEEEEKRKQEEEKMKARETLKRKLEDEVIAGIKRHEDRDTNLDQVTTSTITVIESDLPYHDEDGTRDAIRRASSPSLASGQASVGMSKSASQATITSPQSNRDKRSPSRDEEIFGQTGESEGDIDPAMRERKRKKMRKRLRDTKNKLINLKSKALESLPSMSSLKSKVKEILPVSRSANVSGQVSEGGPFTDDDPAYSIHREQKIFSEYRKRYPDSENEFFSDSELVESRKSTLKAMAPDLGSGDMYDDMDTTVDRVQMLLSPINSPLRPPRKSDYGSGGGEMGPSFHTSEPNISRTGTPKKSKRAPPPRPPPPEKDLFDSVSGSMLLNASATGSTATSIGVLEEIDLTSSNRDLSDSFGTIKKEPEKIPASIYYRKVVRDWRERHSKKMGHEIVSASSPNLETYQRPPRSGCHPPRIPPLPLATDSGEHPRPMPRRRLSRTGSLRQKLIEQNDKESKENSYDGYDILPKSFGHSGLPPLPPPRGRIDRRTPTSKSPYSTLHRRQLQQQQHQRQVQHDYLLTSDRANLATDGLYWKPFSWKTGRCRSLTELYIRKRTQPNLTVPSSSKISELGSDLSLNQEPVERSLSYRLMSQYCSPPRPPPPPTIRTESPSGIMTELVSPNKEGKIGEPIYTTINRSKKLKRNNGLLILEESNGDNLIQCRPLPAPPLPPRSKRKNSGSRSRSNSPYLSLTNSSVDLNRPDATLIRPVSPFSSVGMIDVSVETDCQLITSSPLESKECQTSLENIPENKQISETKDNNLKAIKDVKESHLTTESALSYVDDDFGRESVTPTPTIVASGLTQNQISIRITPEREVNLLNEKKQLTELSTISNIKRTRLSSSSSKDSSPPLVTADSGGPPLGQGQLGRLDDEGSNRTLTSYYDAEECDTDMDTFNDLDSLSTEATATLTASTQFHSVYSEPLTTVSSSTTTATSHYDTDEADSKTMEIPCPPLVPAPSVPSKNEEKTDENVSQMVESEEEVSSNAVPLVAEHVTIEEDSEDDMYQPRVASPSEMRAYISRRQMRPDSMDASDSEW